MRNSEILLNPKDKKRLKIKGLEPGFQYEPIIKIYEVTRKGDSYLF